MKHLALTLTLLTLTLFLICSCTSEIEDTPDSTSDTLSSVVDIVDTLSPEPITTEPENTSTETETTSVEPSFVETTEVSVSLETAPPPTLTPMRIMWELQDNILYFPGSFSHEFEAGNYRLVSPLWQEKCVIFDLTHHEIYVAEYRTQNLILVSQGQDIIQCSADLKNIYWTNSNGETWSCTWTEENYTAVLLSSSAK